MLLKKIGFLDIEVTVHVSLAVTIVFARRKAKLNEVFERIQEFRGRKG